ncbi:Oleosin protein [Dioscorea alata]|uniref:Oleosin protein n=1 Tax=Dioscorea alata TaxID=55571 RepID=A0ACB7WHF8_DIOAL|nr:Oleosin protein [Dioscorea alata]
MAELIRRQEQGGPLKQPQQQQPVAYQVVKAVTAATAGGSMLLLSGLTLAGTVIALAVATPLMVIFSPVLVPAAIAVCLLVTGFLASGGFGVAGLSVLSWMYRYLTGKHPPGADQLDQARQKLAAKAREVKDSAQYRLEQAQQG